MATATATQHTSAEVQQALFNRIAKLAPGASADAVLKLTEAYSWLLSPSHDGGITRAS
jgi:hypothetical protein